MKKEIRKKYKKDFNYEEWRKLSSFEKEEILKNDIRRISITGALITLLIITLLNCIRTIPTGYVGVKTRFGQVQDTTIQEGLNFKLPFIEKIVKIDCRTQKYENKNAFESSTKDMQVVKDIYIAINYSVDKTIANKLYQTIGEDYNKILIKPAIEGSVKSAFSQFTSEELIVNRNKVAELIKNSLIEKLKENGINITEASIKNFDFSEEYNKAIENKATAQQQAEKAKADLEKAKIENERKIENAKAEAEVMRQQNQEITDKTLKLKELEIQQSLINKWNGQLPTTSLGDNIPILNLNK